MQLLLPLQLLVHTVQQSKGVQKKDNKTMWLQGYFPHTSHTDSSILTVPRTRQGIST